MVIMNKDQKTAISLSFFQQYIIVGFSTFLSLKKGALINIFLTNKILSLVFINHESDLWRWVCTIVQYSAGTKCRWEHTILQYWGNISVRMYYMVLLVQHICENVIYMQYLYIILSVRLYYDWSWKEGYGQ